MVKRKQGRRDIAKTMNNILVNKSAVRNCLFRYCYRRYRCTHCYYINEDVLPYTYCWAVFKVAHSTDIPTEIPSRNIKLSYLFKEKGKIGSSNFFYQHKKECKMIHSVELKIF
jgi:hypothetical protein